MGLNKGKGYLFVCFFLTENTFACCYDLHTYNVKIIIVL